MERTTEREIVQKRDKYIKEFQKMAGLTTRQCGYGGIPFTPHAGQENAYEAAVCFANDIVAEQKPPGLLLVGGVGSGKTFLAANIVNYLARIWADHIMKHGEWHGFGEPQHWYEESKPIYLVNVVELIGRLRSYYENNDSGGSRCFMDRIKRCNALILDDLGAEKSSDWVQEKLFEIIDYRYNENLPLIITTNCVPNELKEKVGHRSFDRLREMCALVSMTTPSQRITATLE